jgi:hypothetical protein
MMSARNDVHTVLDEIKDRRIENPEWLHDIGRHFLQAQRIQTAQKIERHRSFNQAFGPDMTPGEEGEDALLRTYHAELEVIERLMDSIEHRPLVEVIRTRLVNLDAQASELGARFSYDHERARFTKVEHERRVLHSLLRQWRNLSKTLLEYDGENNH